ncbi:MAG: hypothetical protein WA395_04635 [Nitrososphaeraceae archaeon]
MSQTNMKMSQKNKVEWRRDQVQQLLAKGHYSHREIPSILQIPKSTISRDIQYLNQYAKNSIKKYIDERLPEEYEKCLVGLTVILREAWNASQQTEDRREKIQALSLAKECYSMKLDLLTNAAVVDDAIRFVTSSSNQKGYHQQQKLSKGEEKAKHNCCAIENQDNNSNEIQGSEEENQRQQCGSAAASTTNQTF